MKKFTRNCFVWQKDKTHKQVNENEDLAKYVHDEITLSEFIKIFIDFTGILIKKLAKDLKINQETLHYWIYNDAMPRKNNMIKLIKFFELEPELFEKLCGNSAMARIRKINKPRA